MGAVAVRTSGGGEDGECQRERQEMQRLLLLDSAAMERKRLLVADWREKWLPTLGPRLKSNVLWEGAEGLCKQAQKKKQARDLLHRPLPTKGLERAQ